jgi:hypothetical protein
MSLMVCTVLSVEGWALCVKNGVAYSQDSQFITHYPCDELASGLLEH